MTQFYVPTDKHKVIEDVCHAIEAGMLDDARRILAERYPFVAGLKSYYKGFKPTNESAIPDVETGRKRKAVSQQAQLEVCVRDGFVDRYSGARLVYPRVLELITHFLPQDFPVTGNWKLDSTHIAYYDLWPSIDHVEPFSRGGADSIENFATTSWVNNLIKGNYTLEEMGEKLLPGGDMAEWDGLLGWYKAYAASNPEVMKKVKGWAAA